MSDYSSEDGSDSDDSFTVSRPAVKASSSSSKPSTSSSSNGKQAKNGKPAIEKIYQKKTQLEHILLRPDTYIGSVETETKVGVSK